MKFINYLHLALVGLGAMIVVGCDSGSQEADSGKEEEARVVDSYSVTQVKITDRFALTDQEKSVNESVNNFAFRFVLEGLAEESAKDESNVALSPLGVTMALGLLANSTDTRVEKEVYELLKIERLSTFNQLNNKLMSYLGNPKEGGAVELANSIWYSNSLSPLFDYVKAMNEIYFADVNAADLSTKEGLKVIDKWVGEKTHSLIDEISDVLTPSSSLTSVMVNALYFAGEWEKKFETEKTVTEIFHTDGGDTECQMMHNVIDAAYTATDLYQLVAFHFKGTSMITLILPNESVGLQEVRRELLEVNNFNSYAPLYGKRDAEVTLGLPKFDIKSRTELTPLLEKMGLSMEALALEKMGINGWMSARMDQKNVISIDEEGAELAAVTFNSITYGGEGNDPEKVDITFNRPFMFFIHNYITKSIIMAGQVVKP